MIYQIIAGFLLIVGVLILTIDLVPILNDWLGRIHIGRYPNRERWGHSVTHIGLKWLNRTPKIKVTDNTRFVALDMYRGNYSSSAIQHWQEASLILGLAEYVIRNSDDTKAQKQIETFLTTKFDESGQWRSKPKHVDGAILAYAVMNLPTIDINRYKPAWDYIWTMVQEHIGEDGTVMYRKAMKDYRYVDTIGFICPFLVTYGLRYNRPECIQLAIKQIKEYEKYGMLEHTFIPSHAYNIHNKFPLGLYGWGRGLGWFAIGLIDAWRELPDQHEYKQTLEKIVVRFAKASVACQREQGNWNWTVMRPETRPDSSTTATLGWFLLNASQITEISQEALSGAERAVKYLMTVTRRNGAVDFSQGDTKDIGVYSMLFSILPFTQGFCIRLVNSNNFLSKVVTHD